MRFLPIFVLFRDECTVGMLQGVVYGVYQTFSLGIRADGVKDASQAARIMQPSAFSFMQELESLEQTPCVALGADTDTT